MTWELANPRSSWRRGTLFLFLITRNDSFPCFVRTCSHCWAIMCYLDTLARQEHWSLFIARLLIFWAAEVVACGVLSWILLQARNLGDVREFKSVCCVSFLTSFWRPYVYCGCASLDWGLRILLELFSSLAGVAVYLWLRIQVSVIDVLRTGPVSGWRIVENIYLSLFVSFLFSHCWEFGGHLVVWKRDNRLGTSILRFLASELPLDG